MAYVLRELGDWDEVVELSEGLLVPGATPDDTLAADGVLGAVLVWRGAPERGRPPLERCLETTGRLDVVSMHCDSAAALAWLAADEGDTDAAVRQYDRALALHDDLDIPFERAQILLRGASR